MPWTIILNGVVLPLSLVGVLLAVFSNFKLQGLLGPTLLVPAQARAAAVEEIEARSDWRFWRRMMWMGVALVVGPAVLVMALLIFTTASAQHRLVTAQPSLFLPLTFIALPLIMTNNRRRTQMLSRAGLATTPTAFSVEHIRKLEALKQTPEWRRLSREAWIPAGLVLVGACLFAAATALQIINAQGLAN